MLPKMFKLIEFFKCNTFCQQISWVTIGISVPKENGTLNSEINSFFASSISLSPFFTILDLLLGLFVNNQVRTTCASTTKFKNLNLISSNEDNMLGKHLKASTTAINSRQGILNSFRGAILVLAKIKSERPLQQAYITNP